MSIVGAIALQVVVGIAAETLSEWLVNVGIKSREKVVTDICVWIRKDIEDEIDEETCLREARIVYNVLLEILRITVIIAGEIGAVHVSNKVIAQAAANVRVKTPEGKLIPLSDSKLHDHIVNSKQTVAHVAGLFTRVQTGAKGAQQRSVIEERVRAIEKQKQQAAKS